MPIPDYQSLMLPVLKLAADGAEHRFRDVVERLASDLGITESERGELLPSGTAPLFDNRVGWARTYLKQAGLLESTKRGVLRITDRGLKALANGPSRIDAAYLDQFPEFRMFRSRRRDTVEEAAPEAALQQAESTLTPEDALAAAYGKLRAGLEEELLDQVKSASPAFFERLVIDVLVAMGYGGTRQDAGRAVGRSGDGGIDGIIKEDRLGLDVIYVQAKRWDGTVGRPEIQKFAGALQGQRANKGVFITTSNFSREAHEYVATISSKIILLDGETLAKLMVDHDVGVTPIGTYQLKRVDTDYFEGE
jgi:restriction system protein